ncbi:hypothetical protein [Bradyrhizobium sp. AUGA SZCCT0431]|uniref:hypothetical protein n=1 Tax=Bradyrhizobium sp. AUGA SZCCT0431 TaxID=2807674 RepID=UPI001BA87BDB|nr:hypothetical protein [Bradyrhizobium sp. AUGA SZCCT0431]MBR1142672.1 hypothetical protein [Bradyrhizobium sp. AUGA SZCCT0431]
MKPLSVGSLYDFTVDSRYQALTSGDEQQARIADFVQKTGWPVYYNFYNPPVVPLHLILPRNKHYKWPQDPPLGQRVIPFAPVFKMLTNKGKGQAPTVNDVDGLISGSGDITCGWRLEDFFADMLLGCSEGQRFDDSQTSALEILFRRRSGPIAAAIAVTVDVGPDGRLPD